ncbi:hypothetical protein PVAP13_6NG275803 [Panicum virgatum]|uniref:Uncharacterized protein n=1 Tax=Panicum virgatum TaxID=38727 RepID=A0A8T0R241_PANVG|nr:hypothetical protein PVAP13_6NG275803 [Panicum virgatum]
MMQDMRPQQGFETLKVTNDCNTMFWLPEFPVACDIPPMWFECMQVLFTTPISIWRYVN